MKVLLPRRNFSIWLFGSAATGGVISACAHVLHNHRTGSDELSRSIGIFIMMAIGAALILWIGYPRSLKGRLFCNATDGIEEKFLIQSKEFELSLSNLFLSNRRVVVIETDWNFVDKKTGTNFIKGSSLKNEKIRCFVDVIQRSKIVQTFEIDVTNTRILVAGEEENRKDRWRNIIEIDSDEINGEVDILFRDFSYLSEKYELTDIIFKIKAKVGVVASRQAVPQKSIGERTTFEIVRN